MTQASPASNSSRAGAAASRRASWRVRLAVHSSLTVHPYDDHQIGLLLHARRGHRRGGLRAPNAQS